MTVESSTERSSVSRAQIAAQNTYSGQFAKRLLTFSTQLNKKLPVTKDILKEMNVRFLKITIHCPV